MYKLNWLRFFLFLIILSLYVPSSLGMEKDEKSVPHLNTKIYATYLLNGEFPTTPFYHFTKGRMGSLLPFMTKRSTFLRKTFFDIYKFSILNKKAMKSFPYNLYASIKQCFVICQNCDHPATSFFKDQKENFDLFLKNRSVMDIKESIKNSFELFLKILEDKDDIDSIDLYLMNHLILGEYTQENVIEKIKKLSNSRINEIAIYYLMNFAFQNSFGDPSPYYIEAKKLGFFEAEDKLQVFNKERNTLNQILSMRTQSTLREVNMLEDSDSFTIPLPIVDCTSLLESSS